MEDMHICLFYTDTMNGAIPSLQARHLLDSHSCNRVRHECAYAQKRMKALHFTGSRNKKSTLLQNYFKISNLSLKSNFCS